MNTNERRAALAAILRTHLRTGAKGATLMPDFSTPEIGYAVGGVAGATGKLGRWELDQADAFIDLWLDTIPRDMLDRYAVGYWIHGNALYLDVVEIMPHDESDPDRSVTNALRVASERGELSIYGLHNRTEYAVA